MFLVFFRGFFGCGSLTDLLLNRFQTEWQSGVASICLIVIQMMLEGPEPVMPIHQPEPFESVLKTFCFCIS